jgi:hypothetical protein
MQASISAWQCCAARWRQPPQCLWWVAVISECNACLYMTAPPRAWFFRYDVLWGAVLVPPGGSAPTGGWPPTPVCPRGCDRRAGGKAGIPSSTASHPGGCQLDSTGGSSSSWWGGCDAGCGQQAAMLAALCRDPGFVCKHRAQVSAAMREGGRREGCSRRALQRGMTLSGCCQECYWVWTFVGMEMQPWGDRDVPSRFVNACSGLR